MRFIENIAKYNELSAICQQLYTIRAQNYKKNSNNDTFFYFPMQKRPKMVPKTSPLVTSPVMLPM